MTTACNDIPSDFEILGRYINEPSQRYPGKVSLRDNCMYPRLSADHDNPNIFTNKISMVRICRSEDNLFSWTHHAQRINQENEKRNEEKLKKGKLKIPIVFRGFLIASVSTIRQLGFDIETAASDKNPFHIHIIIPDYIVPFDSDVDMLAKVLPMEIKIRLDNLRNKMRYIEFDKTVICKQNEADLCSYCHSI